MILGGDNLVVLKCYGRFNTGVIFQKFQKVVTEIIVHMIISRVRRSRTIWYEVFMKIVVLFDA